MSEISNKYLKKVITVDYKGGRLFVRLFQNELGWSYRWIFEYESKKYGDGPVGMAHEKYPGDDKLIEIGKKCATRLLVDLNKVNKKKK